MKPIIFICVCLLQLSAVSGQSAHEVVLKQFNDPRVHFMYKNTAVKDVTPLKGNEVKGMDSIAGAIPGMRMSFPFGYDNHSLITGSKITIKKAGYYNIHYKLLINTFRNSVASCSSDFYVSIFVNNNLKTSHYYLLASAVTDANLEGEAGYWLNKDDSIDLRGSTNVSFWELNPQTSSKNQFSVILAE
jgi:hypothetical protein